MIIITGIMRKIFSIYCVLVTVFFSGAPVAKTDADHSSDNTNYPYIFVHGYFGYGEENQANDRFPYWGLSTTDQMKTLNEIGFTACAADVDPVGSAWDRACELYAQLTGTVVDYGKYHSEKYGHERYGKDYTGKALVEKWDSENKINIICHSFGGPTCSLFASILEYGSQEEIDYTDDGTVSEFFKGGKSGYIYSITGIAGAYNGTSACIAVEKIENLINFGVNETGDNGLYDMIPDNAQKLNETIKTADDIYYFTVPCCSTEKIGNVDIPNIAKTDIEFYLTSIIITMLNTVTDGGIIIDEGWHPNDGLVNTISEIGPFNAEFNYLNSSPSIKLAENGFEKGIYNVLETYNGAHMSILGNIVLSNDEGIDYLISVMSMINAI